MKLSRIITVVALLCLLVGTPAPADDHGFVLLYVYPQYPADQLESWLTGVGAGAVAFQGTKGGFDSYTITVVSVPVCLSKAKSNRYIGQATPITKAQFDRNRDEFILLRDNEIMRHLWGRLVRTATQADIDRFIKSVSNIASTVPTAEPRNLTLAATPGHLIELWRKMLASRMFQYVNQDLPIGPI